MDEARVAGGAPATAGAVPPDKGPAGAEAPMPLAETDIRLDLFSDGNPRNERRLRARTRHIIDANRDALLGRRVLDVAANNGRWSYAAVAAGARSVTSIEGRTERVAAAHRLFDRLGVRERIETHVGDMFEFLRAHRDTVRDGGAEPVDTVLCLGVFYHIMDHQALLRAMAALEPETIIIDSAFVRSFRNHVHVQCENPAAHQNALTSREGATAEPVGFVSLGLMLQMAWNAGYSCAPVTWSRAQLPDPACVQDYLMGIRFTLRLERMEGHRDADWKKRWHGPLRALGPRFPALLNRKTHDTVIDARVRQPLRAARFSVM